MPSIKPVHSAIRAATATGTDTWFSIAGHRGLWLRVRPGMERTWVFRSMVGGKAKKLVLGKYPAMDFDEARRKVDALKQAADGANPIQAERDRDVAGKAAVIERATDELRRPTLTTIADRYLGVFVTERRRTQGKKRSADEEQRVFDKHVSPMLGAMKIEDLRSKDIAAMRDAIPALSERRKAVAVVRALLSHAHSDGLIDANPALGIKSPSPGTRDRVLSDSEIKALWAGTKEAIAGVRGAMLGVLRLQLLTGQRIGEVLAMRWTDVDLNAQTWVVPAAIAKNGRENFVPLSPVAFAIVSKQPRVNDYVFPGHRVSPMSSSAFAQLVERVRVAIGMEDFTSHDLRRTAATRMAALEIPPHVVEAILNHASGTISGIAAIYNRHSYAAEKKRALLAWEREIQRIANDEPNTSNVVPIAASKSGAAG